MLAVGFCRFYYQIEEVSLISICLSVFILKECCILSNDLAAFIEMIMSREFVFYLLILYNSSWFSYVKPTLHWWAKSHLAIMYNVFLHIRFRLLAFCWVYYPIFISILVYCFLMISLCRFNSSILLKLWGKEYSLLFCFFKEFVKVWCQLSFKYLVKLNSEATCAFSLGNFFITNLTSSLILGLFKFSNSPLDSFSSLWLSTHLSICSMLSTCWREVIHSIPLLFLFL